MTDAERAKLLRESIDEMEDSLKRIVSSVCSFTGEESISTAERAFADAFSALRRQLEDRP